MLRHRGRRINTHKRPAEALDRAILQWSDQYHESTNATWLSVDCPDTNLGWNSLLLVADVAMRGPPFVLFSGYVRGMNFGVVSNAWSIQPFTYLHLRTVSDSL